MATKHFDFLIIGNSAAGVSAAERIRANAPDATMAIVSDEPYPAYGRPLISYLIEGKTSEAMMWLKDDGFYERNRISTLFGPQYKATSLDAGAHEITLADGQVLGYGKCLLATGSVPFVPPIEGLDGAENVYSFMTLDDAKALWDAARESMERAQSEGRASRIVVIGAGLIGLKAAEAISRYADEVLVLELAPRILPAVLDAQGAAVLQAILERHGIRCLPGVSADALVQDSGKIVRANLTDGSSVDCDLVVAAVGVRPNSSLAVEAGAEQGRGLVCDKTLQTTLPDVYAAGDVVQSVDMLDGALRPLALWPNAVRQGALAGAFMVGDPDAKAYEGGFAVNAVDFFDASLLTSGLINPAEGDGCETTVLLDGDRYAKFVTREGKLVGYILLNRPNNAGIYTSLIRNGTDLATMDSGLFENVPLNLNFEKDARWKRLHRGYPSDRDVAGRKKVALDV